MEETDNQKAIPEGMSQADFIENDLRFDVDTSDPLTQAALSDAVENEWMDILGNGELKKKTLTKGEPNSRPSRTDLCTVDIIGKLENGEEIENSRDLKIQLGDVEVVQGLDLAIGLMDAGEEAEIEVASRFAYSELGDKPHIPPGAKIYYKVILKFIETEPDMDEMSFERRKEFANKKRERGNWWFSRGEAALSIQCYRRALEYLQPSAEDPNKKPEDKITDSQLQILLEDRTKVYNNITAAQIKTQAWEAALESVDNVLRAEPKNVKAIYRKGRILHKKGEHAAAVTVLQLAAKLDPESKAILQELAILKKKMMKDTLEQKNLYRKMLGTPKEVSSTSISSDDSLKKSKSNLAVWSLFGGALVAITGFIVYRSTL